MREIKFRAWDDHNKEMISFYELVNNPEMLRDVFTASDTLGVFAMQFTGLHDDNDIEIYEGDIVEFMSISVDKPVFVEWNDDTCQFQFSDGQPINNDDTYGIYKRVIGNIYENPELL